MRVMVMANGVARAVEVKSKARVKATKRAMRMRAAGQTPSRQLQARTGLTGTLVAKGANARTVAVAKSVRPWNR